MVLKLLRGKVKSYDPQSGKGLIALKGADDVKVDLIGSRCIRLAVGQHVEFQGIHRPDGIYAVGVRVIPRVLE